MAATGVSLICFLCCIVTARSTTWVKQHMTNNATCAGDQNLGEAYYVQDHCHFDGANYTKTTCTSDMMISTVFAMDDTECLLTAGTATEHPLCAMNGAKSECGISNAAAVTTWFSDDHCTEGMSHYVIPLDLCTKTSPSTSSKNVCEGGMLQEYSYGTEDCKGESDKYYGVSGLGSACGSYDGEYAQLTSGCEVASPSGDEEIVANEEGDNVTLATTSSTTSVAVSRLVALAAAAVAGCSI